LSLMITLSFIYLSNYFSNQVIGNYWNRKVLVHKDSYDLKNYDAQVEFQLKALDYLGENRGPYKTLSLMSLKHEKYEEAYKYLRKLVNVAPNENAGFLNLALASKNKEEKVKIYKSLIEKDPIELRAIVPLLKIKYRENKLDEANILYDKAKKAFRHNSQNPSLFFTESVQLINFAMGVTDFKFALEVFDYHLFESTSIKRYGQSDNLWSVYGVLLYNVRQDKSSAKKAFIKALNMDENAEIPEAIRKDLEI